VSFFSNRPFFTRVLIVTTAVAATLAATVSFWAWYVQSTSPDVVKAGAPTGVPAPPAAQDPWSLLLTDPGAMPAGAGGARPIKNLPAGLPVYSGARRIDARERRVDDWMQQWGTWSIPEGEPDAVLSFYLDAASQAGFSRIDDSSPSSDDTVRAVLRRRGQLLKIRVTKRGARLLLTLIFRYTVS